MITRGLRPVLSAPKKDFLNPAQRKELARSLKDRLTKSFGLAFPGFVAEEVDAFLASQQPVNAKTLAELETRVKKGVLRLRAQPTPQPAPTALITEPDFAPPPPPVEQLLPHTDSAEEIELYRREIAQQEAELEVKRRRLAQTAVRAQLNDQIKAKEESRQRQREAEAKYTACERQQENAQNQRAAEIEQRAAAEKARLLAMQNRIIDERKQALETERRAEREADLRIHDALREELCREKEEAAERVVQKRREMTLLMQQNEEWKRCKELQEEEARRQETAAQLLADQLAEEEEQRRNAVSRARSENISSLIRAGEGTLRSIQSRKNDEEHRMNQYCKRQEDMLSRKEELIRLKEGENKKLYKDYLMAQMAEKENRRLEEESQRLKQAACWAVDEHFYTGVKQQLSEKARQGLREHQATLDAQIAAKEEKKASSKHTSDPELTKNSLKAQLEELRGTKAALDAQLRLFK